jgi:hypothetical protein
MLSTSNIIVFICFLFLTLYDIYVTFGGEQIASAKLLRVLIKFSSFHGALVQPAKQHHPPAREDLRQGEAR